MKCATVKIAMGAVVGQLQRHRCNPSVADGGVGLKAFPMRWYSAVFMY